MGFVKPDNNMGNIDEKALKEAAKPLIKFINENGHPHMTAIVTPTSVELLSGESVVTDILDYVLD